MLLQRLNQGSGKPPSAGPSTGRPKPKTSSSKKRGAKKGHKGHRRQLVPEEQVDGFVDLSPQQCEDCQASLAHVVERLIARFQLFELPKLACTITEYRRFQKTCVCGYTTKGPVGDIPSSPFGPRLMSFVALLIGVYHLSRRQVQDLLRDLLGLSISLGGISNIERQASEATKPAFEETKTALNAQEVKYTDGTTWRHRGQYRALWVIATNLVTVYQILDDATAPTLKKLFGQLRGTFVSDRAKALNFWAMKDRQICFAHLLRKFVSFCERDGPAAKLGWQLVDLTGLLFEYWHAYKQRDLDRSTFLLWMQPVRQQMIETLERGQHLGIPEVSGACADILLYKKALFNFVDRLGLEPTNNHAEQQLRSFCSVEKAVSGLSKRARRSLRGAIDDRLADLAQARG